jgi:hypothetical protein
MSSAYITVSGTSYEISALTDRCKMLTSDLVRTVKEYQALLANYRQSLTLTSAYSGGLKSEVEKADLPQVFSYAVSSDAPVIRIDDKSYDATVLPDEVKAYVTELLRANKQKSSIEFRLRQLDAARTSYTNSLETEIKESQPSPMDPQPEITDSSEQES